MKIIHNALIALNLFRPLPRRRDLPGVRQLQRGSLLRLQMGLRAATCGGGGQAPAQPGLGRPRGSRRRPRSSSSRHCACARTAAAVEPRRQVHRRRPVEAAEGAAVAQAARLGRRGRLLQGQEPVRGLRHRGGGSIE